MCLQMLSYTCCNNYLHAFNFSLGDFLLDLMDMMMNTKRLPDFMIFLVSVIKCSSSQLQEDTLLGIV
jgi:hypothetical protein